MTAMPPLPPLSKSKTPAAGRVWLHRTRGEPALQDLLADPCLHLLLRRDGINLDHLRQVITDAQSRLRRTVCCHAA